MIRYFFYILFFTFSFSFSAFGQLRLIKGLKFVDAQVGIITEGYNANISYNYMCKNKMFYTFEVDYYKGDNKSTEFQSVGLKNMSNFNLLTLKKIVYLNIGAGLNISYEILRATKEDRTKEGFTFGPVITLESEVVLISNLSLVLNAEYRRNFKSSIFENYGLFLIGFRYYL